MTGKITRKSQKVREIDVRQCWRKLLHTIADMRIKYVAGLLWYFERVSSTVVNKVWCQAC